MKGGWFKTRRGLLPGAGLTLLLSLGAGGGWVLGERIERPAPPADATTASESFGMNAAQAARARDLVARQNCLVCHRVGEAGGSAGPDLTDYAARDIRAEDLVVFLRDPGSWYPSATMPAYRNLSREELTLIANYVCGLLGSRTRAALAPGTALDRNVCGPRFLPTPAAPAPR